MSQRNFPFIVSHGPKLPEDPSVRQTIRKQAMQDVALKRRSRRGDARSSASVGTNGEEEVKPKPKSKSKPRDGPRKGHCSRAIIRASAQPDGEDKEPETGVTQLEVTPADTQVISQSIIEPIQELYSPYEVLRSKYQVDIRDLAALTSFNISNATGTALADINLLHSLLGAHQCAKTYLDFVPGRCEQKPCLFAAVECVFAKVAQRLRPDDQAASAVAIKTYARALDSIQKAISDPKEAWDTDTLCAVSLLSIHELLDPERTKAWRQHVAGLVKMIKHRGPVGFRTEYEKALLYAHLGPAITEALELREHCFYETQEWQELLMTYAEESQWLTDRSPLTVWVRVSESPWPGLVCDIHDAFLDGSIYDVDTLKFLREVCNSAYESMTQCFDNYKEHIFQTALLDAPKEELVARREIYGGLLEAFCALQRLMIAVYPDDAIRYEDEAVELLEKLKALQTTSTGRDDWLFKGHEFGVVKCMELNAGRWRISRFSTDDEDFREIAQQRWFEFSDSLRRWVK